MDLDTDIRNYTLTDILKLFSIPIAFSENHLKSAKRTVLKMHPDKCNLPKEYFLFFTKAYRILYQIYSMRHERAQGYGHVEEYAELIADGESAACSADTLGSESSSGSSCLAASDHRAKLATMSHGDFNRWFNSAFEKYRVPDSNEDGYEQWFRSTDDYGGASGGGDSDDDDADADAMNTNATSSRGGAWSASQMRKMERKRNLIRDRLALVASSELEAAGGNGSRSYQSQLQFEDLKRAHTETLIPVTESDFKSVRQFKNEHELKMFRSSAVAAAAPLSKEESAAILERARIADVEESTHRAYQMARQDEIARDMNRRFMREFQTIGN
jgi:hypothetical protein